MTNAQKNVIGWVIVSATCVAVGLVLLQVVSTLFGVNLTLPSLRAIWVKA
jgi:hypothetical protein